ncbi:MAG: PAS domain S-box protein [Desulfohalobiaceae bacterium]|nr:PAS domain S-box protein [Desulfohalobiaceae bacterium]
MRAESCVTQCITKENNRDRLIQSVCYNLVQKCGCQSSWIAVFDDKGDLAASAESGLGEDFLPMIEKLKQGELSFCMQNAFTQPKVVVTGDPDSFCLDCPLLDNCRGRSAMSFPIRHQGKTYGLLSVSIAASLSAFREEQYVFKEIAENIAFALYNLEIEEDQKQAEMALQQKVLEMEIFINNIPHMAWLKDIDSNFILVNQAFGDALGIDPEYLVAHSCALCFDHETAEKMKEADREVIKRKKPITIEETIVDRHGRKRHLETNKSPILDYEGKVVGTVGVGIDITERKKAQESLRDREEKYRLLAENSADIIWSMDADLKITYITPSVERILGYSQEEIYNLSQDRLFRPRTYAILRQKKQEIKSGRIQGTLSLELEHIRKDGRLISTEVSLSPIFDKNGVFLGIQGVTRDITERKEAEELRIVKEAAEKANRAKSDFLSNMSHEIRTPLNGVKGMIQLARMGTSEPKTSEYLDYAVMSADHLQDLINDILDLSKIEAGKFELNNQPLALRRLVETIIGPLAFRAREKGLDLNFKIEETVPDILLGDARYLRQVLTNLVDNAVKFTEEGWVEVSVKQVPVKRSDKAIKLMFQIMDTGIGISKDKQEIIFDSFEQAGFSHHTKFGGTGLGLTISKRLVELMGGGIRVDSKEGEGSTFSFTVEFEATELSVETNSVASTEQPRKKALRILVAEDSKMNQIYIMNLLKSLGHSPVLAQNGREALELLSRQHFGLVLMDIRMPEMDGAQAVRIIRNDPPEGVDRDIPVVALTAYALKDEKDHYLKCGFNAYLTKPIDIEELNKTLSEL